MAGKIKRLLDKLVQERSQGNVTLMHTTKTKLLIKGINTDNYTDNSEDDPAVIAKVTQIALEMNIKL